MKEVVIIGYSGHGLVAAEIFTRAGYNILGYCDQVEKHINPFNLYFLGAEDTFFKEGTTTPFFVAIGDNRIRRKVQEKLVAKGFSPTNAIHPSAQISVGVELGKGIMISANVAINPCAIIGDGVILNTACVVEHESRIGDFAHIAPGAVLCGNVKVGEDSFVGAGSVVRQGISIGSNVMIGAGSVVVKEVQEGLTVFGNPSKIYI